MAERKYWPNGARIEELMREKGYNTAEEFSRALKETVSTRSIQLIVTGTMKHKESTLQIIADGLSIELKEIILPDGQKESGLSISNNPPTLAPTSARKIEMEFPPEQLANVLASLAHVFQCGVDEVKLKIVG